LLKKILYNQARAKFHTNQTTNHIIGNNIHIISLRLPSPDHVIHDIASAPNNNAAAQIQTIAQIKIFQKKEPILTSFGALSNIATSGLLSDFKIFCVFNQI
jgi:hypothetical protein